MTQPQTMPPAQPFVFIGVKLDPNLAARLKTTAAARDTTVTAIVKQALLNELPQKAV